jgi:hypothetical protein
VRIRNSATFYKNRQGAKEIRRLAETIAVIASALIVSDLVPKKGLEPPHPCEYMDLNHARLPIPPLRHGKDVQREWLDEQQFLD